MLETIAPYLASALVGGVLMVITYAKIAVNNVTADDAERIALKIVNALEDGEFSTQEKRDIVTDIIKSMRVK